MEWPVLGVYMYLGWAGPDTTDRGRHCVYVIFLSVTSLRLRGKKSRHLLKYGPVALQTESKITLSPFDFSQKRNNFFSDKQMHLD